MSIKKTYIPAKPRSSKLVGTSMSGGVAGGVSSSSAGLTDPNSHSHLNKRVLDTITQDVIEDSHKHENKSLLDTITQDVIEDSHKHENKSLLDTITQEMLDNALREILGVDSTEEATDENFFSALRVLSEILKANVDLLEDIKARFLSKIEPDTAQKLIKFVEGVEVGTFTTGALGSGAAVKMIDGTSYAEVDNLTVRQKATFRELIIESLKHIGGQLVLSPARMKCIRVVDGGTFYKCYFDVGGGEVSNEFVAGDQARCQVFTGSGVKMYWRLVTSVGTDWINLSKTDAISGSSIPEAGDDIVQLGNRSDATRQNAQILSTVGVDAPSWKQYKGINSFSLEGKDTTVFSGTGNKIDGKTVFMSNGANVEDGINSKNSNYSSQPTSYKANDTWTLSSDTTVNGIAYKSGEILTATQNSTTFVQSHWLKRIRYTDDTAINELEIGGRNLVRNSGFTSEDGWRTTEGTGWGVSASRGVLWLGGGTAGESIMSSADNLISLKAGSFYTISCELHFVDMVIISPDIRLGFSRDGLPNASAPGANINVNVNSQVDFGELDEWQTIKATIQATHDVDTCAYLHFGGNFYELEIRRLKIEKGTKATDWTPTREEVNVSLAKTKFMTEIDGGLIYSAMMKLYDAGGTGDEMAGVSGIAGALKNNPAFWAGGKYEQALALINFLSKMSAGVTPTEGEYYALASISLLHNGAAKIGDFIVEESGRITLVDPKTGKPRIFFNATNIPLLADLLSSTYFEGSDTARFMPLNIPTSGSVSSDMSGSLNVDKNGATINISGGAEIILQGSFDGAALQRVLMSLYLMRNGSEYALLQSVAISSANHSYSGTVYAQTLTGVPSGEYSLMLKISKDGSGQVSGVGLISDIPMSWTFQQSGIRNFLFGLNGFLSYFSDRHIYFSEEDGFDLRGKTNMPGVLASGTVDANGSQSNTWGAKASTGEASTVSGGRRVPLLNLEHNEYTVQITPHTSTAPFRVGTKTSTGFNALGTGAFDYTVIGRNYL